jgi:hypothetical protein
MLSGGTRRAFVALVVASLASAACYDSRWGEAKRAQQRNAARATPATISANEGDGNTDGNGEAGRAPRMVRPYRVRAWANARYAGQSIDWEKQIKELVDASNQVLAKDLGVALTIESIRSWALESDADLAGSLRALHEVDGADDVDFVIGFVGALPVATESFHELGYGDLPGKFLVVRAPGVLGERDQIEKAFDQLDDDTRARVAKRRKQHRAESVLLHELGHALGALHEVDSGSIMYHRYDQRMAGYSDAALALMRPWLAARGRGAQEDVAALKHAELEALEGPLAGAWVPAERESMLAKIRSAPTATTTATTTTTASTTPTPIATPTVPTEIRDADRDTFSRASALYSSGDYDQAWKVGTPLFAAYPTVRAVQDMRCQLAMKRALPLSKIKTECEAIMKIETPSTP